MNRIIVFLLFYSFCFIRAAIEAKSLFEIDLSREDVNNTIIGDFTVYVEHLTKKRFLKWNL